MHQVLKGIKHAVDAWRCYQNLTTTMTKLTTDRFDHIDRLLNLVSQDTLLTDDPRYVVYNPLNIYYLTVEYPSDLLCIYMDRNNLSGENE